MVPKKQTKNWKRFYETDLKFTILFETISISNSRYYHEEYDNSRKWVKIIIAFWKDIAKCLQCSTKMNTGNI